jgi:biopolymer transport protein ExbD
MKLTPLEKRAARKKRNQSMVDLNLVSLIDVFTILIFFLLSNSGEAELLQSYKAVKLPESTAQKMPKDTIVVTVSDTDVFVNAQRVATIAEVNAVKDDMIPGLKAELDLQAQRKAIKPENQGQPMAVTIMGDKDIPYAVLRKVMYTCARANYSDVQFAVRRKYES